MIKKYFNDNFNIKTDTQLVLLTTRLPSRDILYEHNFIM